MLVAHRLSFLTCLHLPPEAGSYLGGKRQAKTWIAHHSLAPYFQVYTRSPT